ncbi:MAG: hypothetical protein ABR511_09650 [Acidimicrobiales bacterium]
MTAPTVADAGSGPRPGRRRPASGRGRSRLAVAALAVGLVVTAAACAQSSRSYLIDQPSFHSAGPAASDELQQVLNAQADSIVGGDWQRLYQLFVPTERARCTLAEFQQSADETFGSLRDRAEGSTIAAELSNVSVTGFRASVGYRFVLPAFGLASQPQTGHYLKLGGRWYLDEKAC